MTLRPYQLDALNAFHEAFGRFDRVLGVLPTGSGKTTVFSTLANHVQQGYGAFDAGNIGRGKVLVLANRRQLIRQTALEIHVVSGITAGIEMGAEGAALDAPVVVASIDSLAKRLSKYPPDHFKLMVIDEAHLFTGARAQKVMNYFTCKKLGVTATPRNKGKRSLSKFYDVCAFDIPLLRLIKEGWLCPITVAMSPLKIDITSVHVKRGDLCEEELSSAIAPYFDAIAQEMQKYPHRKWLCFLPVIQSSKEFCKALERNSFRAAHVDGSMDNTLTLEKYHRGELDVLCCSQLLYFGYNHPPIDGIVNLRQTKSINFYEQLIGRGTRKSEDTLKNECIAEGTLILTDQGEIPIESVTTSMKLWDGTCFANHSGIVFKGEQDAITYQGLTATEDHPVWTKEGWRPFGVCAIEQTPIAITGRGRQAVRLSEGYFTGNHKGTSPETIHGMHPMRETGMEAQAVSSQRVGWMQDMLHVGRRYAQMAMVPVQRTEGAMHEPQEQIMGRLRGEGDSIQFRWTHGCRRVGARQSGGASPFGAGSHRQQRSLRAREYTMVQPSGKHATYTEEIEPDSIAEISHSASRGWICGRDITEASLRDDGRTSGGSLGQAGKKKVRTWDILNCGRFNRFTANGLLVHNCLVLDFLWQYESMGLVRPAFVLAKDEEQGREMQKRIEERGGGNLCDIQQQAEKDIHAKLQEKLRENAKKKKRLINILDIEDNEETQELYQEDGAPHEAPPSQAQIMVLERHGLDPDNFRTGRGASRGIDWLHSRIERGLASMKQLALLRRLGIKSDLTTTFGAASWLLDHRLQKKEYAQT